MFCEDFRFSGYLLSAVTHKKTFMRMERHYCLMWIKYYDVLEFLHVLQLRYVVLELRYVVLLLHSVVSELH